MCRRNGSPRAAGSQPDDTVSEQFSNDRTRSPNRHDTQNTKIQKDAMTRKMIAGCNFSGRSSFPRNTRSRPTSRRQYLNGHLFGLARQ